MKKLKVCFICIIALIAFSCKKEEINLENKNDLNLFESRPPTLPTVSTNEIINITKISAESGGKVISSGNSPVTERGICWNTSPNPTIGNSKYKNGSGTGTYKGKLTGLTANTTYYLRAYATNSLGTAYGIERSFTTLAILGTVKDIDGNVYNTVIIGGQTWMIQNLKTTRYNDGTAIPNKTDPVIWGGLTAGARCFLNNDPGTNATYGKLYNWYAVNTNKLAPVGWHIPSKLEWEALFTHLGGKLIAGGPMKSVSPLWKSPNVGATNSRHFSALPAGYRFVDGSFTGITEYAQFWTSSAMNQPHVESAYYFGMDYNSTGIFYIDDLFPQNYVNRWGLSVRCVKD